MRSGLSKILVTGGAGFIGSEFVRQAVSRNFKIVVVDKLTYAADLKRLKEVKGKFKFYKTDICDPVKIEEIFAREKPDAAVCFAAESHVDRSIHSAREFVKTNVLGALALLEAARKYKIKKIIHVSTDEVYGDIARGQFTEESPLKPNSPYAASKAAADLLIRSYIRTYGLPAIIVRPSNNYGPWQYPEKLIPLAALRILKNEKIPIYGKGKNVREWLYVEDCARGIMKILEKGRIGQIYNLGSNCTKENLEVAKNLLKILKRGETEIEFVKDRPGHDIRYRLNSTKITRETGWLPKAAFEEGLKKTLDWCLANQDWLKSKWKDINRFYSLR